MAGIIPGWVADSFTVHPAKAIKHAMAASGWCPSQIHHFSQSLSNAAAYYLSGILRGTWRSMEHGSCTDLKCFAMNINKDDYTQQHYAECSAHSATAIEVGAAFPAIIGGNCCPPINVNPDDLASIIGDRGGIPLLSCFMNRSGRLQARVTRADFRTEYVAISHVWAGGMGNPKVNGLPKCQFLHLYHLVRSILAFTSSGSIYGYRNRVSQNAPVNFWIDTLCIPVPQSLQSSRNKAIDLLPETYSNARTVLVLDPELQSIQHKGVAIELILARVQSSPWMSRYWTLREASLSRSLYIQFADGALNAGKLLHEAKALVENLASARPGTGAWERRYLVAELARALLEMDGVRYQSRDQEYRRFDWSLKLLEENQAHSFAQTWNNLLGRDTSRIEDLHQILAGMQDINLAAIRPYRPEDRMKAILKSHATLPVDLLFCRSEKIPNVEPVNAWAPMYPQGQRLNYYLGCMRVHTDCLLLHPFVTSRLHVCIVDSSVVSHSKFILKLDDRDQFWVERSVQNSLLPLTAKENHFVVLFPKVDDRSMTRFDHKCDGALFIMTKREHKSLWLMYASSVQVSAYDCSHSNSSQDSTHGEPPSLSSEREEDGVRIFVDCSLDDWPTVPTLYNSIEGPIFEQPSGHIMMGAFVLSKMIWTLALIIGLAVGPQLDIKRWPIVICFMAVACFTIVEGLWYFKVVFADISRELWVHNINRTANGEELSIYELLNRRPLLMIGPRRAFVMVLAAIGFIVPGVVCEGSHWALWCGIVIALELILRCVYCVIWIVFPRWSWTKSVLATLNADLWPKAMERLRRGRADIMFQTRERAPFQEEELPLAGFLGKPVLWWVGLDRGKQAPLYELNHIHWSISLRPFGREVRQFFGHDLLWFISKSLNRWRVQEQSSVTTNLGHDP
ncbi:hypothetical protein BDR22DRAFT_55960 [Usnea florida]